ncbi:hypothetical protein DPMN_080705 [Dreissena polymorpha]|uniref:Uncharacterized protein n=1 Tax=Dreissena polymorpha TaxID=45954 RepID=A0A9D3YWX7_DREPO|nr:hypothetical protein DPMN_080705 [Dreissena polymorpha]
MRIYQRLQVPELLQKQTLDQMGLQPIPYVAGSFPRFQDHKGFSPILHNGGSFLKFLGQVGFRQIPPLQQQQNQCKIRICQVTQMMDIGNISIPTKKAIQMYHFPIKFHMNKKFHKCI